MVVRGTAKKGSISVGLRATQSRGKVRLLLPSTWRTIHHADTLEVAREARRAGVKHLVLTHLIPMPDDCLSRRMFADGISDFYNGKISVGEDGMHITP